MVEVQDQINKAVSAVFNLEKTVELSRPEEKFGDFSTNIAMQLAKEVGKNPRQIADQLAEKLGTNSMFSQVTVAGPGFINLKLTDQGLTNLAASKLPKPLKGKTIVAEYSDPNPFKVLHAGHLYTTLVGDAVAKLLETAGAKVYRLNYGGDVGLHVGRTMWAIIEYLGGEHPEKLKEVPEDKRPEWVSARYVEGNTAYEENEQAKQQIIEANKKVYQLHEANDQESSFAQIYWTCRQWSYDGFDEVYEKLKITPFEKYIPESLVTPLGLEITKKGLDQGVFKKSDGAIVFEGEPHGLHTRVFINSKGLPTYEAKDLGLAALKWQDYEFDRNIIITANDIEQYMQVVLKALSSFYPEAAERTTHLTHGVLKLPGGIKMSSRKGNTLLASDILQAAETASHSAGYKDNQDTVLAAIKYAFVKQRIGGDIIYNPEESVSLQGNSGPYLQYAHARARSILSKNTAEPSRPSQLDDGERKLVRKIGEFGDAYAKSLADLMPHHIANYLFELAQSFNSFYENNRVSGDKREAERLWIVQTYADTLKAGLDTFNIIAPEKM